MLDVSAGAQSEELVLTVAGAGAIAYATEIAGQQAAALAIYTVIASLGVIGPVIGYFLFSEKVHSMP